jgi:hypothetical protein
LVAHLVDEFYYLTIIVPLRNAFRRRMEPLPPMKKHHGRKKGHELGPIRSQKQKIICYWEP